jgi:hypothetical protein
VEVDWRSSDCECVDTLRMMRRVDRRQPASLAVADEIHGIADVIDGALDHIKVVLDGRPVRSRGRADPVERVRALEPSRSDCAHLALRRRVVHDARVVSCLRRQHKRGKHAAAATG